MTDRARPVVRVESLDRALLEGVLDTLETGTDTLVTRRRVDLGVIPYFRDERPLQGLGGFVDWRCHGKISAILRAGWCTGATGDALLLPGCGGLPFDRLALVGLGNSENLTREHAGGQARSLVEVARRMRPSSVLVAMPGWVAEREPIEALFAGICRALEGSSADSGPPAAGTESRPHQSVPWWVVVDPRHVARLRRLLKGPPRAAERL